MLNFKAIITTGMVLCVALTGLAGAAIYDWTGAADDGNWNTVGNWLVTGSAYTWPNEQFGNEYINEDADEINLTNGDTVSRSGGLSPDGARDASNVCKVTLDNGTTFIVTGTMWIADYDNTQGRVDVLGGSFLDVGGQLKVGDDQGSIGTLNVVDSRIDVGNHLVVANYYGSTGYLYIANSTINIVNNFYMNDASGAGVSTSYVVMDSGTVNMGGYCTFNDDIDGTATFILNGGSWNVGSYLNLSDNLDGHAYLTINAGEMISGGSLRLGKDGGTDIGQVRIYMNGGLLQGEDIEFVITDSKIIFSDGMGKLKINSLAVSEADMQAFIDSGNIDVSALVDYTISTDSGYTVLTPVPGVAGVVAPLAGASGVPIDTILEWLSPEAYVQSGFRVYFGDDPNEQSPYWYGNNEIVSGDNVNEIDPAGDLENLTTYYWRVDAIEPNTLGIGFIVHEGMRWNFTTISAFPTVETQPIYQSVVAGGAAEFTIVASNTDSYQWFQSQDAANDTSADDVAVGTDSATLSLANVQVSDEGYYFCEASNSAGSDKSAVAKLIVERLIHHYPLDNESAADAILVGAVDGTVVGDPNWIAGIDGGAIDIFPASMSEFEDYIVLGAPGDISYEVYDFTVSFWMKTPPGLGSDPALISNKDWGSGSNVGWVIAWGGSGDGIYQWNFDTSGPSRDDFDPTGPETADNQWHLVTVAHDRQGMATFYIDGEFLDDHDISAHAGNSLDAEFPTVIGNDGTQNYGVPLRCAFDDVRIYNYVLDPVEVATLYTDIVEGAWRCANRPLYDFSDDCVIGLADIAFLVTDWLDCGWHPSAGCL